MIINNMFLFDKKNKEKLRNKEKENEEHLKET